MIDNNKRKSKEQSREKQRQRMHVQIDEENYEYIPAQKQRDYYDTDLHQRVAVYARVSTDDERQIG